MVSEYWQDFFLFVAKHACDGQTDGQHSDSQDSDALRRAVKKHAVI